MLARVIRGYPEQPSPHAGGEVLLHVATDAPEFRVEFYRGGASLAFCARSPWLPGRSAPSHLPFHDWGQPNVGFGGEALEPWPAYRFDIPASWAPGVYVAMLVEGDGSGREVGELDRRTADAREAKALFVVRRPPGAPAAPILYKLPLLTYHAYNVVDGAAGQWCLYTIPAPRHLPPGTPRGVNVHRPGGGTGGCPWDLHNVDPFDPTPRQAFVHWDGPFLGWLERAGYDVDYCTDVDLHREGAALVAPYRLLLSAGHDEYWSDAMRSAIEQHVARGGNAAFFGGNTCWWRVVFDDPSTFSRVHFWSDPDSPGEPENTLLGVSFRNGGERDRDDHPLRVGYRVQHADHWVYAGTGLRDGDEFGVEDYLVGYECDGADFDRDAPSPVVPSGLDGTPPDFTILGIGDTRPSGWGFGNCAATMGIRETASGGTVFTGATTDWPRVLASRRCPSVERITRNVLDALG
ncbi:MAG: GldG family protein [Actinomycetota bacterium]|nr:GldG family protein [Actinomycetota bacterium]